MAVSVGEQQGGLDARVTVQAEAVFSPSCARLPFTEHRASAGRGAGGRGS